MNRGDLVEGLAYALRVKSTAVDDPFVKVVYVGLARSYELKVRYFGGELDGLEEWVRLLGGCSAPLPWRPAGRLHGEIRQLYADEVGEFCRGH